ncbi:MAG: CDP-diacylglycerol--glycerol-3-phosphate 3-phosphatidyltransferase [Bryobacterales bacterium]|nr:CDP-diacylglycerol--glycerol-3-phosphate 3-phosphatidyltransferase [Bryobacterales bacterium]MDE0623944.1 CDP-diacylglycerol--glycerol-3-phosphate 3-phosphatidyltransferase [Bryobacterales bacterium]
MNLPNLLTLSRIFLVPLLVAVLLRKSAVELDTGWVVLTREAIALAIFLAAALTDLLDGYLARRRRQVTTLGKLLDPIADKVLVAAALISLVELDRVAAWMVVLIVSREFAVSVLRNVALSEGIVIVASEFGKAKMVSQVAAVSLLLLAPHSAIVEQIGYVVLWLALLLTVWSMVDYFRAFLQRTGNAEKRATEEQQAPVIRRDVSDVGNRS